MEILLSQYKLSHIKSNGKWHDTLNYIYIYYTKKLYIIDINYI